MPQSKDNPMMSKIPGLRMRAATKEDLPLILQFVRELADYEKMTDEVVLDEAVFGEHLFGERSVAEVVIAEYEGAPAGFTLFFPNFSTFLGKPGIYLEDLYVRPAMRGKGIGKALLSNLARLACVRGCGRLEWSVLDWNEPAIGFYQSIGARAMDQWTVNRLSGDALEALGNCSSD
jgi:GNAT superfamily N-acetyltransferase